MLYPFTFRPIFKERVWGGRELERLYHKALPPGVPIGESWEISDRPGDVSIIANGLYAGKDLRWLMENHAPDLLGGAKAQGGRFPLLVKILDAQDRLSLQVHPPLAKAAQLGGEPKTEMWYVAEAAPGAELYVGLKRGVTRAEFEQRIVAGTVAECVHCVGVRPGDSLGLDGKPRELHVPQSLASIDFNDYEPSLVQPALLQDGKCKVTSLVREPLFSVEAQEASAGAIVPLRPNKMQIIALLAGLVEVDDGIEALTLAAGQFGLVPASLAQVTLRVEKPAAFLRVEV
jgi:mannose-6-phosphate isomerase